jgi:hypothetical protein
VANLRQFFIGLGFQHQLLALGLCRLAPSVHGVGLTFFGIFQMFSPMIL